MNLKSEADVEYLFVHFFTHLKLTCAARSAVPPWWEPWWEPWCEPCGGRAGRRPVMEKPPQSVSCFLSACGNSAQFKEAPSLRSPIVFGGSRPGAALLFPSFQPRLWQTCCDRAAGCRGCPAGVTTPTCSQSLLPVTLCQWNSSLVLFFHRRKLKENPSFLAFKNLGLTFCKEMQH